MIKTICELTMVLFRNSVSCLRYSLKATTILPLAHDHVLIWSLNIEEGRVTVESVVNVCLLERQRGREEEGLSGSVCYSYTKRKILFIKKNNHENQYGSQCLYVGSRL